MREQELQAILDQEGLTHFKQLCYGYARHFTQSCILDSCQLQSGVHAGKYELLAAYGASRQVRSMDQIAQGKLDGAWQFGLISYDAKNRFETLESANPSFIEMPEVAFFEPLQLISVDRIGRVSLLRGAPDDRFLSPGKGLPTRGLRRDSVLDREAYMQRIREIKDLILQGEVYELNYCVQHRFTFSQFDPIWFQQHLLERSPVPMAAYFQWEGLSLCGASMERYMAREGDRLISQPIKGTIRKGNDREEDKALMLSLYHSEKDRAENVMIVDLVRNDLAKICRPGSVQVDELFGIYSYLQLHQMISSISGQTDVDGIYPVLQSSFPMGSMTGTPKIAAMQQIERLEDFKRGWYSGCLGYVDPDGNADFNVVIRSLICDREHGRISYSAGGAITIDSVPESEWLECQLKTKAIDTILLEQI